MASVYMITEKPYNLHTQPYYVYTAFDAVIIIFGGIVE